MVLLSLAILAPAMIYTVSNFGTLFRLREMVFLEFCLLPLVMIQRRVGEPAGQASVELASVPLTLDPSGE